jgi:hypothetical protein
MRNEHPPFPETTCRKVAIYGFLAMLALLGACLAGLVAVL